MQIRVSLTKRHCSGQILAEACIGLSLLAFVWILVSYHSFMTENRIRTAMAARHVAWRVAKDPGVNLQTLAKDVNDHVFYSSSATVQKGDKPVDHVGSTGIGFLNLILANKVFSLHNPVSDPGPYRMKVTFGITQEDLKRPGVAFPFSLMNTHVPFMTNSLMAGFLSVNSQCQWAAIGDPWMRQPSDPMKKPPLSWIKSVGDALNNIFSFWNKTYTFFKWLYVEFPECVKNCSGEPPWNWWSCYRDCFKQHPPNFECSQ